MKKLITLLLALLFILTACTSAVAPQEPEIIPETPEETPHKLLEEDQEVVEKTDEEEPAASDKKVFALSFYGRQDDTIDPLSLMWAGLDETMAENGIEYETVVVGETIGIEEAYQKCLDDPAENKVVVLTADFNYTFSDETDAMKEIQTKWKEAGINTIQLMPMYERADVTADHIFITRDVEQSAVDMAGYLSEILQDKKGKLLITNVDNIGAVSMRDFIDYFNSAWEVYGAETDVEIEFINVSRDDAQAMASQIEQYAKANENCVGVVSIGSNVVSEGYAIAKENSDIDDWVVVDMGCDEETLSLVNDGTITGVISEPYYGIGSRAARTVKDILDGVAVENEVKIPYEVITTDNAQAYYDEHFA